jgi:hypothetical protein
LKEGEMLAVLLFPSSATEIVSVSKLSYTSACFDLLSETDHNPCKADIRKISVMLSVSLCPVFSHFNILLGTSTRVQCDGEYSREFFEKSDDTQRGGIFCSISMSDFYP